MWVAAQLMAAIAWGSDGQQVVCPSDGAEQIVAAARITESSFWSLETEAFEIERLRLRALLPCVQRAVTLEESLSLHHAFALDAYVEGDLDAARRSFGALRMLDPAWVPPAPPAHPVWALFNEAPLEPVTARLVVMPEGGWSVDGTYFEVEPDGFEELEESEEPIVHSLPTNRAFVLQVFSPTAAVTYTGYHFSPVDVALEDLVLVPDRAAIHKRRQKMARRWGSVLGGALLAGAGVTLGLGLAERGQVTGSGAPLDGLQPVQDRGNLYGWTSAGLATLGATTLSLSWGVRW
jgi:hypothetical protein